MLNKSNEDELYKEDRDISVSTLLLFIILVIAAVILYNSYKQNKKEESPRKPVTNSTLLIK